MLHTLHPHLTTPTLLSTPADATRREHRNSETPSLCRHTDTARLCACAAPRDLYSVATYRSCVVRSSDTDQVKQKGRLFYYALVRACFLVLRRTFPPLGAMNVPLTDSRGLFIYRELMNREQSAAGNWHLKYGPEALMQTPDPSSMVNLGNFQKLASVPMPLEMQLKAIQKEHQSQKLNVQAYEKSVYPQSSDAPVSELSVKFYGEAAWHSKPKATPAPATYEPYKAPIKEANRRRWDVDRIQYVRESLGPAHQKVV